MKKALSILLSVLLLLGTVAFGLTAAAEESPTVVAQDTCGQGDGNGNGCDSMNWKLYSDGTLIVSGSGEMEFCYSFNPIWSWYGDYKQTGQMPVPIKKIVIEPGIDNITDYAFSYATALESIVIPDSMTRVGSGAFEACNQLTDVYYAGSKTQWQQIHIEPFANEPLFKATIHYGVAEPGDENDAPNLFQKIIQWFRDLFDRFLALFK